MRSLSFVLALGVALLPFGAVGADAVKNADVVTKMFPSDAAWADLFPIAHQGDNTCDGAAFLTRDSFIQAVTGHPKFLSSDDMDVNLRELAAFLANVSQETTGATCTNPKNEAVLLDYSIPVSCSQPLGGTCFVREMAGRGTDYCASVHQSWIDDQTDKEIIKDNCADRQYFGRGALQITNPKNYADASEEIFGTPTRFLNTPDELVTGGYSWTASLNFWMNTVGGLGAESVTTVKTRVTAHEAIAGHSDFGKTIEVINGNIECGEVANDETAFKVRNRVRYYQTYLKDFGDIAGTEIATGNLSCISGIADPGVNRCGATWSEAASMCMSTNNCQTDSDCPSGLKCFAGIADDPCAAK